MRSVIVFFVAAAAVTANRQQNSAYGTAPTHPAPSAPINAGNGYQQAYAAPQSPPSPPPPAPVQNYGPRPCPAPYALPPRGNYATPPQSSYPAPAQNSYGTSPPPPVNPAPVPGGTYGGAEIDVSADAGNGIGYKNRRVLKNRALKA